MFNIFGKKQRQTVSVEELTLTTMGMRFTHVYKISKADGAFTLFRYRKTYRGGEDGLELEIKTNCIEADFIKLMNDCNVLSWDGFHGKHPKNVSDGTMFNFSATVNEDRQIKADGSENFPRGYREFVRTLDQMLYDASAAYEEKNSKALESFHTDLTFGIEEKICLDLNKKQLLLTVGAKPYVITGGEIESFEEVISEVCESADDKGYRFCLNLSVNTPIFDKIMVDLTKGNRPAKPDEAWYLECHMQLLELKSWLREWTYTPSMEQTFLG
ncbi:MAG: hypothetical protein IJB76_07435 [Clostridia bacterium]|nr:hypothetical protein [Clostridia bacterium]